ncbi:hypothetical protein A3A93_03985 [Candidatus Roizmanbacteria bacterium RIFCSPLOWO2_01_FULL_38_12]|uniref:Glutamyl-tRNA amidotransferase n=1 Tax=Candidatus Roizmanbacteria bacterium RIFCSPLOWO2_01_FULL_38_12 TaxID=1802061 RepID=A0A1F7ITT3_9BACT|nr:MAG: hypothetical protein A3A93_03985 [Candidatus Roizmanbacteria bacterium RIFCSPLOWO2_01_FULL_38_12]
MLKQKLQEAQITALKSNDKVRLTIIRYILSQIKNREIDKQKQLTDNEIIDLLRRESKKLDESITAFKSGRREDLVAEYEAQKNIVAEYLPKELSDDDLKAKIQEIIGKNQELYDKNPSALIGICIKELSSQVNSSRIAQAVMSFKK